MRTTSDMRTKARRFPVKQMQGKALNSLKPWRSFCMFCPPKSSVGGKELNQTALQRQIDATDWRIDALAYHLSGLTDEEIRIVEEATE